MIAAATAPELDLSHVDAVGGALGVAVSGGGDSVALAVLLCRARPQRDITLLTVNHGLRPEAADECRFVAALGATLGRRVEVLTADGPPVGSLQAWAREARYTALAEAAATLGLAAVATAHTADDQAETMLLRLARGSGLKGLAAMRPDTTHHGLRILRPLLGTRRETLRVFLRERGIAWREDPSNDDTRFDRIAMRALAPELERAGLSTTRLAATATHLARASDLVDTLAAELLARAARRRRTGATVIAPAPWFAAHEEVRLRAFAEALRSTGGLTHPPRFATLAAADAALRRGEATTLGRCRAVPHGASLALWREARGIEAIAVAPGGRGVFDGRYAVALRASAPEVRVAAAGPAGRAWAARDEVGAAAETMPAVFVAGALVALPTLGVRRRDWPANAAIVRPLR
ncbi:tRNA lysidine(34) synthetase TilS [Acuticoccus sp. I52.16.1]|uniref:tRNA lysidine(34) synthetase TilS n=1 Tax=Acuticoccus sp. I52.16.1 TaxID=2928472 RepID=UPI001FD10E72|nr:tRNA lysidine(34) synthetase TilS [Acuticoccus sp. I52.16.1]UOM36329.1 tRNA lysidine(34) synthetase TilS [Acuticoccus sp. I52.16.1]